MQKRKKEDKEKTINSIVSILNKSLHQSIKEHSKKKKKILGFSCLGLGLIVAALVP